MMTLLFGFFVMLMSFSKIDVDTYEKARREATMYFGGIYKKPFENLHTEVKDQVEQKQLLEQMHFDVDYKGVTVTFEGGLFFAPGSIELKEDAKTLLASLVPVVRKQGPNIMIVVEGHTDDNPINDRQFPSNWELSAFRASTVLRVFEKAGFNRTNLRAIGFGDTLPAFPNRDKSGKPIPENQAQNRRVILRIGTATKKE
jgi:chemotaxis protein MotB